MRIKSHPNRSPAQCTHSFTQAFILMLNIDREPALCPVLNPVKPGSSKTSALS